MYESQTYITAGLLASGYITQRVETFLFTCVRFHHGGALQLQEDYGCALGKGEDQKKILSTASVNKVLMKVITASGLRRHRSFENSTENSDRNSSVSGLFDSAVCTLRLQVVKIFAIVTAEVTI